MPTVFRLDNNDLCIHDATRKLEERRPFTPEDINKLTTWRTTYRTLEHQFDAERQLLTLGKALYHWLNGDAGWLKWNSPPRPNPTMRKPYSWMHPGNYWRMNAAF